MAFYNVEIYYKHFLSDDQSIYFHAQLSSLNDAIGKARADVVTINHWMKSRGFALNPYTTQANKYKRHSATG